jgi:hypothetical protein
MQELATEADRRRAIAWAVALTSETALAPDQYESELLEKYARGETTLEAVLHLLDTRVHHLLYRSKARMKISDSDLTSLVEQSQQRNKDYNITGLLCYCSDGHFVQVLEGASVDVHTLYARIKKDTRHTHVQALSDRASPTRWFADWRMTLVQTEPAEFHWLIGYLEAKGHNLIKPQMPITTPQLTTLLRQFSLIQPKP